MGAPLRAGWKEKWQARGKTSGDFKIDLVAICDFAEPSTSNMVVIAQCAATSRVSYWEKKRSEARRDLFQSTIQFLHPPYPILFIPSDYRDPEGNWYDEDQAAGVLLLDRLRIINLLMSQELPDDLINWPREIAPNAAELLRLQ